MTIDDIIAEANRIASKWDKSLTPAVLASEIMDLVMRARQAWLDEIEETLNG